MPGWRRLWRPARLALLGGLLAATAAAQEGAQPGLGETTFNRICAACHTTFVSRASPTSDKPVDAIISRSPPRESLRNMSPETILAALTSGKMQPQGAGLSDAERRAVAEYAAAKPFGALTYGAPDTDKPHPCPSAPPVAASAHAHAWNGWGNGLTNARHQPASRGGLTAADLPRLKLRWAFGYTNTEQLKVQPTVFAQRVFTAAGQGDVYALDVRTGCTYWHYKAPVTVSTTPVVGPYEAQGRHGYAVYVAGQNATVYAIDADSGRLVWQLRIDEHKFAGITGSPILKAGRLYVPVQGVGEEAAGPNYPCCTFRGSVAALDASTGAVIWKTYTVGESKPRAKNDKGLQLYGPSGGGIWSSPTIDEKRGLLYVGTGNSYSDPPQPGTDAIIAMDLKTGAVRWMSQVLKGDDWVIGCGPKNPDNPACPADLGPDYDFSGSPILVHTKDRDLLIAPQKSGLIYAFDPDKQGQIVWQQRYGKGSGLGGQWGAAVEGDRVFIGTADLLSPPPGGMHAYSVSDGRLLWEQPPQPRLCLKIPGLSCSAAQGGALTAIPGAVLNAGLDGGVRAYAADTGKVIWVFDTNQDFKTVNSVTARGGAMDHGGPVVVDGMMFVNSGYGGFVGHPGNVLVALGID
jgi:polyvinyl alcohol dehydrogenase (cytochrome)